MYAEKSVTLDGLTLTYRDEGEGPALVLIHGMGGGSAAWVDQITEFKDAYRVVAWDGPGYATSDPWPHERPDVADYAGLLAKFLDAVGVDTAHLAGHSIGASFIAGFYGRFPDRVRSLLMLQAHPGYGMRGDAERDAALQTRIDDIAGMSLEDYAVVRARNALAPGSSDALVREIAQTNYLIRPEGQVRQWAALCDANIYEELDGVDVPAMLVVGEFDKTAGIETAKKISAAMGDAPIHVIDGVGHVVYREAPEAFNAVIGAFLEEVG